MTMHSNIDKCFMIFLICFMSFSFSCTGEKVLKVVGPYPDTTTLNRCLLYWTSHFSNHQVNHYYAGKTNYKDGLVQAFIYWKEERILIEFHDIYLETNDQESEILAFHHNLKLDRDTVDTIDDIAGSTYLITHKMWVNWMEDCIKYGRKYVINLNDAMIAFPKTSKEN